MTLSALSGFVGNVRMGAWTFHDSMKWIGRIQPTWTREYVNITPIAKIADGVETFCDGPVELAEHSYELFQTSKEYLLGGGAASPSAWPYDPRDKRSVAYKVLIAALSVCSSGSNTLKALNNVDAIALGGRLVQVGAVGTAAGFVKSGVETVELASHFVSIRRRGSEDDDSYNRRAGIGFFDLVTKVTLFSIKALAVSGLLYGVATSSVVMLSLSSTMLSSYLAMSVLKSGGPGGSAHDAARVLARDLDMA